MKAETKISLGAVAVLVCSLACVCLISFSNQRTESAAAVAAVAAAAVVVAVAVAVVVAVAAVVAAAIVVVAVVVVAAAYDAAIAVVVAVAAIVAAIAYDKDKKRVLLSPAFLLLLVFILPFAVVFHLSKYHNIKQLERDGKIASVLQISTDSNNVTIVLPAEYAGENSYLKKVLSIGAEPNEPTSLKPWKELAVFCKEGEKEWYKATLPGDKKEALVLFFNHAWKDKTIVLPIP